MELQVEKTTIAIDIAKKVFQVHKVDPETGEITRKRLDRREVAPYFAQLKPCGIAMEACGTAQHWARLFRTQGHNVKLISLPGVNYLDVWASTILTGAVGV